MEKTGKKKVGNEKYNGWKGKAKGWGGHPNRHGLCQLVVWLLYTRQCACSIAFCNIHLACSQCCYSPQICIIFICTADQPSIRGMFQTISNCVDDISWWLLQNGLLLNSAKTEVTLESSKFVRPVKLVKLGQWSCLASLSTQLWLDHHVTGIIRICTYHT